MSIQSKIPVLDMAPEINEQWAELNAAFQSVLKSGYFINGPEVKLFEDDVARYLGVKHAVGLNSGTDALVIALRALGIGEGDEVLTTAFSFFATSEAIHHVGATPVYVDIEPASYCIDCRDLEKKITKKTKAIIPVHLYGHASSMDEIMHLARTHNLRVVEDVAQAFSGEWNGKKLGTIGDFGAFSFFPSKNLGGFGDGGMLVTNDSALAELATTLRSHGSRKKYFNEVVGYNSRLDTLQAALLRVKLPLADAKVRGRRDVAARYNEAFSGIKSIQCPTEAKGVFHSYCLYNVRILDGRRDLLQKKLKEVGIETMVYYPIPLHRLPLYAADQFPSLKQCERASGEVLSLPIWPSMPADTQAQVVKSIKGILAV